MPAWQLRRPKSGIPKEDPKTGRIALRGLEYDALGDWLGRELDAPRYRTAQVFRWLHVEAEPDFAAMSNLSLRDRQRLSERARAESLTLEETQIANDGTRKLRLRTRDGYDLESVLIPNQDRGYTQCISSQVGCAVDCTFCATAKLGFRRNLEAAEIVDQVHIARRMLANQTTDQATDPETGSAERVSNIVYMGMGEPLHNFNQVERSLDLLTDPRGAGISGQRITISSSGLVPAIERFLDRGLAARFGLAISLNASDDATRDQLMPINRRWNIKTLLDTLAKCPRDARRRLTFEYVLLAGVNDSDDDARRLGRLLNRFRCHINVIPFNPHPQAPYRRPSKSRVERFMALCRDRGLTCFLRTPRGDDIDAACGQLALKSKISGQASGEALASPLAGSGEPPTNTPD